MMDFIFLKIKDKKNDFQKSRENLDYQLLQVKILIDRVSKYEEYLVTLNSREAADLSQMASAVQASVS